MSVNYITQLSYKINCTHLQQWIYASSNVNQKQHSK